jgi:hypothetical protein
MPATTISKDRCLVEAHRPDGYGGLQTRKFHEAAVPGWASSDGGGTWGYRYAATSSSIASTERRRRRHTLIMPSLIPDDRLQTPTLLRGETLIWCGMKNYYSRRRWCPYTRDKELEDPTGTRLVIRGSPALQPSWRQGRAGNRLQRHWRSRGEASRL